MEELFVAVGGLRLRRSLRRGVVSYRMERVDEMMSDRPGGRVETVGIVGQRKPGCKTARMFRVGDLAFMLFEDVVVAHFSGRANQQLRRRTLQLCRYNGVTKPMRTSIIAQPSSINISE